MHIPEVDHVYSGAWEAQAWQTIEHNVRIFRGETIVQPSPSYEGLWARDTMIIALGYLMAVAPTWPAGCCAPGPRIRFGRTMPLATMSC
jgi:hypothetical protein